MSHAEDHEGTRRDFLYYATAGAGAVATGAAVWPLVNQMNPSADVRALSTIHVDVSGVDTGTQLTVKWLGKPVFVRRRTEAEITESREVEMSDLVDPIARNANVADLGCVPLGNAGDYTAGGVGGWFCPCHGSHYDTAGRIRKGPAPQNLPVPAAEFVEETTILLG